MATLIPDSLVVRTAFAGFLLDVAKRQQSPYFYVISGGNEDEPSSLCHVCGLSDLAGNVADMLATCRPNTAMSANFSRKGMSRRHKTCEKRPRHTQFIPITADKFKSAQTYEYPSYHRVFVFELKQQSRNCRHLKTCHDMSSNVVSF
jgi:hypothetical protein